jgi:DNA-binding PadR family transcriptional regulator
MSHESSTAFGRDLMRGSLDLMVLAVLADGPLYGYLVQKRIREASANLVRIQAGTLYPLLHKLESAGAIVSKWERTTGRDRKWYELTAKGKRRLQHQAGQWHQYVECLRALLGPIVEGPATADPAPVSPA